MKFASAGAVDSVGLLFCGDRVNSQFFVLSVFIAMDTNFFVKKRRYCNSRIVKFSANGKFLMHWGKPSENIGNVCFFVLLALVHCSLFTYQSSKYFLF